MRLSENRGTDATAGESSSWIVPTASGCNCTVLGAVTIHAATRSFLSSHVEDVPSIGIVGLCPAPLVFDARARHHLLVAQSRFLV
ncbi:hypothetical protein ARMGADRAFT_568177 [Armillaria gallica]|uniref:Uncharacterized protein n=1 Tax=Armillaria gallica TaxID=47427 RepID=A0A2H3DSB6_ARMGA|nr:hypothetical protein ARMGADRAFT_568177 [Armillaria gallica]